LSYVVASERYFQNRKEEAKRILALKAISVEMKTSRIALDTSCLSNDESILKNTSSATKRDALSTRWDFGFIVSANCHTLTHVYVYNKAE